MLVVWLPTDALSADLQGELDHSTPTVADLVDRYSVIDAELRDMSTVALASNRQLTEVIQELHWEPEFARHVEHLRRSYPSSFSGARITRADGVDAVVAFEGAAPADAEGGFAELGVHVDVRAHLGYSRMDLMHETGSIVDAVQVEGFESFTVAPDFLAGTIDVAVEVSEPSEEWAEVERRISRRLAGIPASNRVRLQIVEHEVGTVDNVNGGGWLEFAGSVTFRCTSGFTIVSGSLRRTTTAGHCDNSLTYEDFNGAPEVSMTLSAEYNQLEWGDVQMHEASAFEADDFYGDGPHDLRDVQSRGWAVEGQTLCRWGHGSGEKRCDGVYRLEVAKNSMRHLVAMNNDRGEGGDSGGPWFYALTAYGFHHGAAYIFPKTHDVFTEQHHVDNAFGCCWAVATS